MTHPILHFAHANSFPAGTYRLYFESLQENYDLRALELHAHNARFPVTDGWHALAQELIEELCLRYRAPVILAGHSMGGMLCLMAAQQRPDLVRCVVLLDAPVVAGWRAMFLRLAKSSSKADRFSPASLSVKRRHVWPDADAAFQHLASKKVFSSWAPGVLADYLAHGLIAHPEGVTLRFTREAETAVYRGLPHHIGRMLRQPL
ncbi:MAG: alpha/beta hydrolase, partial [Pseudomonadota bacterium]